MEKKFKVRIPVVPNFIIVGGTSMPISDFTDAELNAIGAEWTKDLKALARARRKDQKNELTSKGSGIDPNPVY